VLEWSQDLKSGTATVRVLGQVTGLRPGAGYRGGSFRKGMSGGGEMPFIQLARRRHYHAAIGVIYSAAAAAAAADVCRCRQGSGRQVSVYTICCRRDGARRPTGGQMTYDGRPGPHICRSNVLNIRSVYLSISAFTRQLHCI